MKEHQYKDYSEWMIGKDLSEQKEYWTNELSGEIPIINLPLDYIRPKEKNYNGATTELKIENKLNNKIKHLSKITRCTDYMVFLSAIMILLSKYGRQEDIIVGTPISARTHKDTEDMLGMFANTLALRGTPTGGKMYLDFLREIKEKCLKAYKYQEYPFENLVESINIVNDTSRNPIFDIMFVFQEDDKTKLNLNGLEIELVEQESYVSKFDLTFKIICYGQAFL